nr:MAG TPA: hypothetical protein [Caudoviricetes sp.]
MKYFYPEPESTPMKTRITAIAALIFGFVLGAFSAAQATKPEPNPQPVIKTYDCDTLQDIPSELYFNPTAAHQIQKLHDQCQQQRNAIMLQQQWEKDPTGGVVLEHHKN